MTRRAAQDVYAELQAAHEAEKSRHTVTAPTGAPRVWRPGDPPQRPVLFVNPARRRHGGARGLGEKACARGIRCVVLEPGQELAALVREAIAGGADTLGMAGGDGSMAVVAAAASAHGLPFVCVPAGTRNHFARDLGVRGTTSSARSGPSPTASSAASTSERSTATSSSTTSRSASTATLSSVPATGARSCGRCSRRPRRCSVRARARRRCGSSTTRDASTRSPRCCSSRTTRTRSTARCAGHPAAARYGAARHRGHRPAGRTAPPSRSRLDRTVAAARRRDAAARGHRRRGAHARPALAVREPTRRAAGADRDPPRTSQGSTKGGASDGRCRQDDDRGGRQEGAAR